MLGEDLEWYTTLAELENVSAAGDILHIAQPTLSRMLARLEHRLGTPLFDRHGKRLTLNEYGRLYYEYARRARAELQAGQQAIADRLNPAQGVVRLSFLHSFGVRLVPQLIGEFRRTRGRVGFLLHQDDAEHITREILDGTADLGIVAPRPAQPGLGWRTLLNQPLVLAVPTGHRLATRREIRLTEVRDAEFIINGPGAGMRRIVNELFAAADLHPRIAFEADDLTTAVGLVAAGLGIAVVPHEEPTPAGIAVIPLADPGASREVGLIWSAAGTPAEAVRHFRDFAEDWAQRRQAR